MSYKCPAGQDCFGKQICSGVVAPCTRGLYCPGFTIVNGSLVSGAFPDLCPKGSYCPNTAQKSNCPSGYFCPAGTSSPRECSPFALCPAGSYYPQGYLGALLSLFIPLIVLGAVFVYSHFRDSRRQQREKQRKTMNLGSGSAMSQSLLASESHDSEVDSSGLRNVAADVPANMNIRFDHVNYHVSGGKKIMQDVSAVIRGGRCTCIMGPSGAGKTTFLSALMGKITPSSGRILFNGHESTGSAFRSVVGYVPQDDNMIRILTPKETLLYCAAYRLPPGTSPEKRVQIVNATLAELGLTHVRHVFIGDEVTRGISGGQRKRVNIGMEMVSNPLLLFLDEPTTGLDSTASLEVVEALVRIASTGRVVATVIHQPRAESFLRFDDLILLAKGGFVAYAGPVQSAVAYFEQLGYALPENCNPADFVMDVVSGKIARNKGNSEEPLTPEELSTAWTQYSKDKKLHNRIHATAGGAAAAVSVYETEDDDMNVVGEPVRTRKLPNFLAQFVTFSRRAMVQMLRDQRSLLIASFIQFIGGFLIGEASTPSQGPIYLPPVGGAIAAYQCPFIIRDRCINEPVNQDPLMVNIFYLSMACGVAAVSRAVATFGDEKNVIRREYGTGRSTTAYALSKMLVDLPLILYGSLLFCSVFMALCLPSGSFGGYFIAFFGMQFAAAGFGYFVSVIASTDNAMVISIVSSISFAICSGWRPTLKQVGDSFPFLEWLWALSYARWGGEAIYINEVEAYSGDYYVQGGYDLVGYKDNMFGVDIFLLFLLGVAWRFVAVVAMHFTLKQRS
eukprot:ANDGO_05379.mRNA.1 Putative white-brown complex homolog protein 30